MRFMTPMLAAKIIRIHFSSFLNISSFLNTKERQDAGFLRNPRFSALRDASK